MSLVLLSTVLALVLTVFLAVALWLPSYRAARYRWWLKAMLVPVSLATIFMPLVGVSLHDPASDVLDASADANRVLLFVNSATVALMGVFLYLYIAKESPKMQFDKSMRLEALIYRGYRFVMDVGIPVVLALTIVLNLYNAMSYL